MREQDPAAIALQAKFNIKSRAKILSGTIKFSGVSNNNEPAEQEERDGEREGVGEGERGRERKRERKR